MHNSPSPEFSALQSSQDFCANFTYFFSVNIGAIWLKIGLTQIFSQMAPKFTAKNMQNFRKNPGLISYAYPTVYGPNLAVSGSNSGYLAELRSNPSRK